MIGRIDTVNGQKIVEPISGSIPTGNPVGTLLSRANGQVPRNYLECDGSTFNEGQYPALYLYLGTNVLPERFDHSILSDTETITNFQVGYEMPYDGFIIPDGVWTSTGNTGYLKIDDKTVSSYGTIPSGNAYASAGNTIAVKKGQKVTAMVMDSHITYKAMWFKKHLYIKAVDGVDISDEDTFLVTVKNFVDEKITRAESYTTEEQWTGGYWYDGKKIYRRVITVNVTSFGDSYITLVTDTWVGNIDSIVNGGVCMIKIFYDNAGRYWKNNTTLRFNYGKTFNLGSSQPCNFIVEYTKTTD